MAGTDMKSMPEFVKPITSLYTDAAIGRMTIQNGGPEYLYL